MEVLPTCHLTSWPILEVDICQVWHKKECRAIAENEEWEYLQLKRHRDCQWNSWVCTAPLTMHVHTNSMSNIETGAWACIIAHWLKLMFFSTGLRLSLWRINYKSAWVRTISQKLQHLGLLKKELPYGLWVYT